MDEIIPAPSAPPVDEPAATLPLAGLRSPPVLDGFILPPELFVRDVPDVRVRLEPSEYAFFAGAPAEGVVRAFSEVLGPPSRAWRIRDRYFDAADHRLFRGGVSVRVREYLHPERAASFEVVCVSWRGEPPPPAPEGPRTVRVLVQTFERIAPELAGGLPAQYAHAGLAAVGGVEKTRTCFELYPFVSQGTGSSGPFQGTTGIRTTYGDLQVVDHGLRVLVDEMHDEPFRGHAIVEVEFDPRRAAQAAEVVARLAPRMGRRTTPKERAKIAYLLGEKAL